ncbi:MAG: YlbF family regulator [Pelolinea sp.]|nr:YlbF family regulator [Pelolinea sp.]
MITKNKIEIEISTELELSNAIRDFTNALVETTHYKNYESANESFQNDPEAQKALQEYRAQARDLQTKQMFNTIYQAEQKDLEQLWIAFQGFKSVQEFFDAQEEFQSLCRECAQVISDNCGLDYATSCGASCCG